MSLLDSDNCEPRCYSKSFLVEFEAKNWSSLRCYSSLSELKLGRKSPGREDRGSASGTQPDLSAEWPLSLPPTFTQHPLMINQSSPVIAKFGGVTLKGSRSPTYPGPTAVNRERIQRPPITKHKPPPPLPIQSSPPSKAPPSPSTPPTKAPPPPINAAPSPQINAADLVSTLTCSGAVQSDAQSTGAVLTCSGAVQGVEDSTGEMMTSQQKTRDEWTSGFPP